MTSILVTGAEGQLGKSIRKADNDSFPFECSYIDMVDLDLTNAADVRHYFNNHRFDYVINCAAYTSVDKSEQNPNEAFAANAAVPFLLGEISRKQSFRLIHISSDYVFDGNSPLPYEENSNPLPLSIYGKSKLEGELALQYNNQAMIMRSSWLYSEYGSNFVKTILRSGLEKEELNVVFDQVGSPTYATDLALAILYIINNTANKEFPYGIFHYSNEGICSWYDFAWEIVSLTGLQCNVHPVKTEEYPLPAKRPPYSVLNKAKIKKQFGIKIPYWKESLRFALKRMTKN